MPPLELLKLIFGALSRDDLDALMLTNVLFHDVVLRDFATEPLRYFAALKVHATQGYRFEITWENDYFCEDIVDFSRRMRLASVGELRFASPPLDENLLKELLPAKDAWRNGHVQVVFTPWTFTSQSLCDRAFSELLFCKSMHFDEATRAHRYVVKIYASVLNGQSSRFVNKDTSEVLTIGHGTDRDQLHRSDTNADGR